MPTAGRFRHFRLPVIGCGLFALVVIHVSLRYLFSTLFGFVTYRGLAPPVPFLALGAYMILLVGLAMMAAVRRGNAGVVLGVGLLVLAVEPITSAYLWADGCEVSTNAGASLVPEMTVDGVAFVLYSWNGACSTSLNTVLIGIGLLWVGSGLWTGSIPDVALARWMSLIEVYWPSEVSE